MKKLILLVLFSMLGYQCAMANLLSWASTVGVIGDHNGVALSSSPSGDGVSSLVQLIYAGADDTIDVAVQSGFGITGDDEVVAYAWIGRNVPSLASGQFQMTGGDSAVNTHGDDSIYYIRAWEAPAPSSDTGFVPVTPTYYGDSETYTIKEFASGNPETFNVQNDFNTTIAIPEPTVAALVGIFGLALMFGKRFAMRS